MKREDFLYYKSRKIELEFCHYEMDIVCNGCAKRDFLSTKVSSRRTVSLIVNEPNEKGKTAIYYCSNCAVDALKEIMKEGERLILNPELDYEQSERKMDKIKQSVRDGNSFEKK
jgi:hypothetical protein